jgi:hypothetical protein
MHSKYRITVLYIATNANTTRDMWISSRSLELRDKETYLLVQVKETEARDSSCQSGPNKAIPVPLVPTFDATAERFSWGTNLPSSLRFLDSLQPVHLASPENLGQIVRGEADGIAIANVMLFEIATCRNGIFIALVLQRSFKVRAQGAAMFFQASIEPFPCLTCRTAFGNNDLGHWRDRKSLTAARFDSLLRLLIAVGSVDRSHLCVYTKADPP